VRSIAHLPRVLTLSDMKLHTLTGDICQLIHNSVAPTCHFNGKSTEDQTRHTTCFANIGDKTKQHKSDRQLHFRSTATPLDPGFYRRYLLRPPLSRCSQSCIQASLSINQGFVSNTIYCIIYTYTKTIDNASQHPHRQEANKALQATSE
jgi:hypothetical protein